MSDFEDVKKGDELFYIHNESIKLWGQHYFRRRFTVSCKVDRFD